MLKVIIISILVLYAIYRLSGFLTRILSTDAYNSSGQSRKDSNVRVDKNPNKDHKPYDGGEYVDYEEVK